MKALKLEATKKHAKKLQNQAKARAKPSPAVPKPKQPYVKPEVAKVKPTVLRSKFFVIRHREQSHLFWNSHSGWTNDKRATVYPEGAKLPTGKHDTTILGETVEVCKPAFAGEGFSKRLCESSAGEQWWEPIQAE